ncbi:fibronectin type III domain-containing protein [Dactylosporangium roseum]|uniref:Fibronectin type III domain-containing protein n=1 Tax=Dactylosporangium roseum TaxID=47989 RepID=A0ABY5ZF56_9ACTN|nr:fibronectin type III domain-containing protein [Dactylosporangium roseum]UWZ38939.1 fibronectin type III domain-containing protein [Dactylosporangium roseum]
MTIVGTLAGLGLGVEPASAKRADKDGGSAAVRSTDQASPAKARTTGKAGKKTDKKTDKKRSDGKSDGKKADKKAAKARAADVTQGAAKKIRPAAQASPTAAAVASSAPAAAPRVLAEATQTITFTQPPDTPLSALSAPLTASASSELPVTFTSTTPGVCAVGIPGGETLLGAQSRTEDTASVSLISLGTCTIEATQLGGDGFDPAPPVSRSFEVTKDPQTITFTQPTDLLLSVGPTTLDASASSGLQVAFTSTTTAVCTVVGNIVTPVVGGICTIDADQAGNGEYLAAPTVTRSFEVLKNPQVITFGQPADTPLSAGTVAPGATASSGLPVTYTSSTPTVCTVYLPNTESLAENGVVVTLLAGGTCTIDADQAGDPSYKAAATVTRSFEVLKNAQTITFGQPDDTPLSAGTVTLTATASSELLVTYASSTPAVCTVDNPESAAGIATVDVVATLVGAGTCTIDADQAGNGEYLAAPTVTRSFEVLKNAQTITFGQPADTPLSAGTVALTATASSNLSVMFTSGTPAVCTVGGGQSFGATAPGNNGTVTLVGAGTCTVTANQAGDADHLAAPAVTHSFAVTAGIPTGPAVPAAPGSVTAVAGISSINVTWTAPPGDGPAVTGYTATASPGPATCTTTGATSCVLGGTAGVSYTVTVVAHSAGGNSVPAGPSNAVVPTAPPTPASPPDTPLELTTDRGRITTAAPGQAIVVIGTGFAAYSTATITIYSAPTVLATVTTDGSGNFTKAVTVPPGLASGQHTFVAAGVAPDGLPHSMKLVITVAAAGTSDGSLPVTGAALTTIVLAGAGMVLAGGGLTFASRPRRA